MSITAMARSGAASLLLAVLAAGPLLAQDSGSVTGRVSADGDSIPFARVAAAGSALQTVADGRGRYLLTGLPAGPQRLLFSAAGHETVERLVTVAAGELAVVDVALEPAAYALNPIVVTGTMKQATVLESTVKVDVVPAAVLQRTVSNSLMESIQYINGLYQQVDCGVCYTNNIRINGTEGPYTAVLIDGMPIMSSLASVYGLNGINPALIERIEILKGPSSTLYGTEAMGGVINVITKSPRFTPTLALDAYHTSFGESNVELAVTPRLGETSVLLSGSFSHADHFMDENGDGFTDAPLWTRGALFGKLDVRRGDRRALGLSAKYYHEDRFGGVEAWTPRHRGSGSIYGESIVTERFELLGTYLLPFAGDRLRTDFSLSWHDQDSYYGTTAYAAQQGVAFANLVWDTRLGRSHDLLLGATARYQLYDDGTPATPRAERRWIPGVFAQDEWSLHPAATLLAGLRLDHHREHGLIASPRLSAKWTPFHDTSLRINTGTGFRVVNLFTEDHAALTGARDVVIAEALEPERSYSVAANLNQIIEFGRSPMMIDLDAFYTRFSNKIIPDYDVDPNQIVYDNLRGHSVSRGVSLSLNQNVAFERLLYTAGVSLQDVYAVERGERRRELFAARYSGTFGLTYNHPGPDVTVDYAARLTGPMRLPEFDAPFDRPTTSTAYTVHDLKLSLGLTGDARLYAAVSNLFGFTQGSPLIAPDDPFGDAFDTTYVWGPIAGRKLSIGARYGISR